MKKLLLSLALPALACMPVWADELGDAQQLHAKHQYAQALPLFTKLANEGNVQAQSQLGEMYWYGDGMPVDLKQAESWFTKAAQAGDKKALAALAVMKARVARKQEIEYYTLRFDGGDLRFNEFGCVRPKVPEVSRASDEIQRVTADIQRFADCYNSFARRMTAASPALKLVPKDLLDIMSDEDIARAKALMDKTLNDITRDVSATVASVNAQTAAWKTATQAWVAQVNKGKGMTVDEWDAWQRESAKQAGDTGGVSLVQPAAAYKPASGK